MSGVSEVGFNINVLLPGQPNGMYHGSQTREDFLVLSGECVPDPGGRGTAPEGVGLLHCPPMTEHIFVGAVPGRV